MDGYITNTDERDQLAVMYGQVASLARQMGIRFGDLEEPMWQLKCALACRMPIKKEDGDFLKEALHFLHAAWRAVY